MSSHSSMMDNSDSDESPFQILPVEVFLHICSFLDTRFLLKTLRLVCTRFNTILSDESVWKLRIARLISVNPCTQSAIDKLSDYFSWKELSYHIDYQRYLWGKNGANMRRIKWQDIHYSSVDCVKLIKGGTLCLSGSRDRAIGVWNVEDESPAPLILSTSAHDGWVWNFAVQSDEQFYSASWDHSVKQWNLNVTLDEVARFPVKTAALCVDCREDLIVAGTYSPQVVLFDPRAGPTPLKQYTSHRQSVIAVCLVDNYIVSSSSDQTVSVYDLRTDSVIFQNIMRKRNRGNFGKSLSHKYNLLYVGDNVGNLHVFDSKDGSFSHIQTAHIENVNVIDTDVDQTPPGHATNQVSSIWHGPGCVIVGSTNKYVRVLTATLPHMLIAHLPYSGEVTSVDYNNCTLAVGTTDNTVEVWKPKNPES
ncbi:unnamed protein product [Bemisia tabaci]|uniref:F-box domain-containing protein n=1 Tax=Bemisia tabaci TaxID=7038 RepID=A0A9P0F6F7_BEMTA|nr:PREDICTED: F-box/WD repeat-containing protein 9-like [Bemisia tabaci]CAH0394309.1 unnamed protein product [Bemisia tabaci]